MPIYEYSCLSHGIFSLSLPLRKWDEFKPCPNCGKKCQQILTPQRSNGNFGAGVTVHVSADGRTRFPGDPNAKVPKGFEKRVLKTIREVEQFERDTNVRLRAEAEQHQEREAKHFDAIREKNRSDLRQAMQHFSPLGRDLAETAIRMNNERKRKPTEVGFHCVILHNDASREAQVDASTGWKKKYV